MAYRIMVVDDEEAFVGIAEELLTRAGFEVIAFASARSALHALPDVLPDMILSDIEMPIMDGFDFLRAVRADAVFASVPFALMTAKRTFPPDRVLGLNLGSDDYINKPFSGDELVARVKALLRRSGKTIQEPEGLETTPPVVEAPSPPEPAPAAEPTAPTNVETTPPPEVKPSKSPAAAVEPPPPPKPTLVTEEPKPSPASEPPPAPKAPEPPAAKATPPAAPEPPPPLSPLLKLLDEAPPPRGPDGAVPKQVLTVMKERLAKGSPVALILADLSFFRGFNECKGYDKGDEVLEFTRFCLESACRKISGGNDLVLPLFADEFLVLTEPSRAMDLAQAALSIFSSGILQFYGEEDRRRGFLEGKNRLGRAVAYPIINLVLGLSTNIDRKLTHPGQFVQICRELLAYAKTLGGSRCVLDRRKDPPRPR